jgi:hypothetical protein
MVKVYASPGLRDRVMMAVATQQVADPQQWLASRWLMFATSPGWGDSWASGRITFPDDPDLGARDDVITDGMILSAVQSML